MNTAVTTNQSFEQRVFERMRENIGQLMTDEELTKLLTTAMNRIFFTGKEKEDAWRHTDKYHEPELYKLVRELLEPRLRAALDAYLNAHPEEVKAAIDKAIAEGFTQALARSLNTLMAQPFAELQNKLFGVMHVNNLRHP